MISKPAHHQSTNTRNVTIFVVVLLISLLLMFQIAPTLRLFTSATTTTTTTALQVDDQSIPNEHHLDVDKSRNGTSQFQTKTFVDENSLPTSAAKSTATSLSVPQNNIPKFLSLQHRLKDWHSCLDSKGSLQWTTQQQKQSKRREEFGETTIEEACSHFRHLLSSDQDSFLIDSLNGITVESHGDSTLRELTNFLIKRFKVEATLEKADANMSYRVPKFFSREIVLANDNNNNNKVEGETPVKLLLRVMFRFDFFGKDFLEPFDLSIQQVPSLSSIIASKGKIDAKIRSKLLFFDEAKGNIMLLSIGSHVAKTLVMDRKISEPVTLYREGILKSMIHPLQDLLIERVFGFKVVREYTKENELLLSSSVKINRDAARAKHNEKPKVDLFIFWFQSVECESMGNSQLSGFRKMSMFCESIQEFLDYFHETFLAEISDLLVNSLLVDQQRNNWKEALLRGIHTTTTRRLKKIKKNMLGSPVSADTVRHVTRCEDKVSSINVLCQLSSQELQSLATKFLYVSPMHCGRGIAATGSIQNSLKASKPYCTKDGIHLRSKYLRVKLDVLLNVLKEWLGMVVGSK